MDDDINNPQNLNLSDLEKIKFVESKPYFDLSSGFTALQDQKTEEDANIVETEDSQLPLETLVANFSLIPMRSRISWLSNLERPEIKFFDKDRNSGSVHVFSTTGLSKSRVFAGDKRIIICESFYYDLIPTEGI